MIGRSRGRLDGLAGAALRTEILVEFIGLVMVEKAETPDSDLDRHERLDHLIELSRIHYERIEQ